MEDDTYRGMFIPAGSVVFANVRYDNTHEVREMTVLDASYSDSGAWQLTQTST
jgi:hypothetical protein